VSDMQLGLWLQDPLAASATVDLGQQDGVLIMHAHRQFVSGLAWMSSQTSADSVISCSYDGSILLLDAASARHHVVR
jgi:hypothetical protein